MPVDEMKRWLHWCTLENMLTGFPSAVPEIPVTNVEKAAHYYVKVLGFHFDWGNDQGGIGGISQGNCRMFLTNPPFREEYGTTGRVVVWLNLESKQEVDELYQRWKQAGAKILANPEDKPWRLREFTVADLDGNHLRVLRLCLGAAAGAGLGQFQANGVQVLPVPACAPKLFPSSQPGSRCFWIVLSTQMLIL